MIILLIFYLTRTHLHYLFCHILRDDFVAGIIKKQMTVAMCETFEQLEVGWQEGVSSHGLRLALTLVEHKCWMHSGHFTGELTVKHSRRIVPRD